jgi:hypothetical protein
MPDVWVSRCRRVTRSEIVVPARSTYLVIGASRSSFPAATCCSTATEVKSLVTEAVSKRICSVTGTGQRRLAGPYAPENRTSSPEQIRTTPEKSRSVTSVVMKAPSVEKSSVTGRT